MTAVVYEYIKNHLTTYIQRKNCMGCELYLRNKNYLKKQKELRNNCLNFSVKWPMISHIKHKLKITLWKEISKET